ncbi:MAG: hypothetical protein WAQ98_02555 [Blastocatellia bacterium]
MTKKQYIFALIVLTIAGFSGSLIANLILTGSVQAKPTINQAATPRTKYIYTVDFFPENMVLGKINQLGSRGFDILHVEAKEIRNPNNTFVQGYVVFMKQEQ